MCLCRSNCFSGPPDGPGIQFITRVFEKCIRYIYIYTYMYISYIHCTCTAHVRTCTYMYVHACTISILYSYLYLNVYLHDSVFDRLSCHDDFCEMIQDPFSKLLPPEPLPLFKYAPEEDEFGKNTGQEYCSF